MTGEVSWGQESGGEELQRCLSRWPHRSLLIVRFGGMSVAFCIVASGGVIVTGESHSVVAWGVAAVLSIGALALSKTVALRWWERRYRRLSKDLVALGILGEDPVFSLAMMTSVPPGTRPRRPYSTVRLPSQYLVAPILGRLWLLPTTSSAITDIPWEIDLTTAVHMAPIVVPRPNYRSSYLALTGPIQPATGLAQDALLMRWLFRTAGRSIEPWPPDLPLPPITLLIDIGTAGHRRSHTRG